MKTNYTYIKEMYNKINILQIGVYCRNNKNNNNPRIYTYKCSNGYCIQISK